MSDYQLAPDVVTLVSQLFPWVDPVSPFLPDVSGASVLTAPTLVENPSSLGLQRSGAVRSRSSSVASSVLAPDSFFQSHPKFLPFVKECFKDFSPDHKCAGASFVNEGELDSPGYYVINRKVLRYYGSSWQDLVRWSPQEVKRLGFLPSHNLYFHFE